MIVLGLDTSLSNTGWVIAEVLLSGARRFFDAGIITTEPGAAHRKGDDTSIRVQRLYRDLLAIGRAWKPDAICVEAPITPFGKTSMRTVHGLARARSVVDCLAVNRGCPLFERAPVTLKIALTGNRGATKSEMVQTVRGRHPELEEWLRRYPDAMAEHIADAAAAVLSCTLELQSMVARGST